MQVFPIKSNEVFAVAGATNATPIVVTTNVAHGMANAETVDIEDVQGNLAANGTELAISSVTSTTFTLAGIAGNGTWETGTGLVATRDASARTYDSDTAVTGHVWSFPEAKQSDKFNFYVDCSDDPTNPGSECDVRVYGRVSEDSDWFEIEQIDHTDTWAQVGSGRFISKTVDLAMHPQLRIDVVAEGGSTTNVRGWIATP